MRPLRLLKVRVLVEKKHLENIVDLLNGNAHFYLSGIIKDISGWEELLPLHGGLSLKEATYIEGWIPAKSAEEVSKKLKSLDRINCTFEIIHEEENAPTILRNHKILKPFENIVRAFGTPAYNEIDPTPILAMFFPLIFSLMFADLGQGFLLTLLGLTALIANYKEVRLIRVEKWIEKEIDETHHIIVKLIIRTIKSSMKSIFNLTSYIVENASIFLFCGIASMVTGLLFGEFFGHHIEMVPFKLRIPQPIGITLPINSIEDPMSMLKLSILVGGIHIGSGLVMSTINKILEKDYLEAFLEPGCWLWFYVSFIYSIFTNKLEIMRWITNPLTFYGILAPLTIMLIGKMIIGDPAEGFAMTFEVAISSLSNTISYGRILALNLAHSLMSSMFIKISGGNIAMMAIGTLIVMILEGLVIFIHTTRLMWVEWFSKFYKGTGSEVALSMPHTLFAGKISKFAH